MALKDLQLFEELATAVVSERPGGEIMQQLADQLVRSHGFQVAVVTLFDWQKNGFRIVGLAPLNDMLSKVPRYLGIKNPVTSFFPAGDTKLVMALKKGKRLVGKDMVDLVQPYASKGLTRAFQKLLGIRQFCVTPLIANHQFIGSVVVTTKENKFTREQLEFLSVLGRQAALVVRQSQLVEESRALAERYRVLGLTDTQIIDQRDPLKALQTIVANVHRIVPCDISGIFMYDEERKVLSQAFTSGQMKFSKLIAGYEPTLGKGILGKVAESRVAEMVNYAHRDKRSAYPKWFKPALEHLIAIPLKAREKLLGVLYIARFNPNEFTAMDLDVAKLFGEKSALAIVNTRLLRDYREREEQIRSIHQINTQISGSIDLATVLDRIITEAVKLIPPAQKGSVWLLDDRRRSMYIAATYGYSPSLKDNMKLKVGQGYGGKAAKLKKSLIVENVSGKYRLRVKGEPEVESVQSAVVVPMIFQGQVVGVISLDNLTRRKAFTTRELAQLELFAANAVVAYTNARLYTSVEREVKKIQLLNEIKSASLLQQPTERFLKLIVNRLSELFGYALVTILTANHERRELRVVAAGGSSASDYDNTEYVQSFDTGVLGWVVRNRKSKVVNETEDEPLYYKAFHQSMKSEMANPIIDTRGTLVGVLNIENEHHYAFSETDLRSMETIAAEIGSAFDQTRILEALRASENLYRTVVESANDIITAIDQHGRYTFVNRRFTEVLGYTPDEVMGADFTTIIHADDRAAVEQRFRRRMKGEPAETRYNLRMVGKDGSVRTLELNVSLIQEGGKLRGVLALGRDMSDEIDLQRKLKESEQNYQQLFEKIKDTVYITTPEGAVLDVNQAGIELFGYGSKEELLRNIRVEDLYANPHDRKRVVALLERHGFLKDFEVEVKARDGRRIIAEITTNALRDPGGTIVAFQGILRDVTRQRMFERALAESEEKYRSLVEDSFVGVYVIQDGCFILANARLAEIFGYTTAEVEDRLAVVDIVAVQDRESVTESIRQWMANESGSLRYTFTGLRKDGREIDIEAYGSRSLYQGRPAIIGTLVDRTQERRSMDEIAAWRQRYDLIVASSGQIAYDYHIPSGRILWSGSIERVLGYPIDEMAGGVDQWESLIHPDDRAEATRLLDEAEAKMTPFDMQYRFMKKGGTYVWVHDRGFIVPDRDGKPERMLGMMEDIERQKNLEQKVMSSERKYRSVFEHANDAIVLLKDDRLVDANPQALAMFDTPRGDLLGQTLYDFSPPYQADELNSKDAIQKRLREAASGIPQQYGWRHIKRTGQMFDADVRLNRLEYEGEVYVQALIRDITAQRDAQEQLERSEQNYRLLIQGAAEAILVTDGEGRFIEVNDKACSLLGYSVSQFKSRTVEDILPGDPAEVIGDYRRFYARLFNGKGVLPAERWMKRHDGTTFPFEINSVLLPNGYLHSIIRDVSDRRKADQEFDQIYDIAASLHGQDLFDRAAETIAKLLNVKYALVGELQEDRTVLAAHAFFENGSMSRGVRLPIAGTPCAGIVQTAEPSIIPRALAELHGGESLFRERGIDAFIGLPMMNSGREVLGIVIAFNDQPHDFTDHEKKLLSVFAQRLASELEALAQHDRERELSQQLMHSQKMESLGTLAGGVAHDFNNILSAILGYTTLLHKHIPESTKEYHYLEAIEKSANRAASLARQLLGFAHRSHAEIKMLYVNDIVRETVHILENSIPKSITIRTELAEDLPMIEGDIGLLGQVVMNVCLNARDAMLDPSAADRPGTMTICTTRAKVTESNGAGTFSARPGDFVIVSVNDTGVGMSADVRRRVFEPFFTTKEQGKGTGLGLAVAYGIIRSHNGFIDVKSEPGVGSTFDLYLPVSVKKSEEPIEDDEDDSTLGGHGETILLVDDEAAIREIVAELLSEHSYRVLTAANGKEAVEIFKKFKGDIDMVVLDMLMPELDGSRTFVHLKEIDPGVKVLVSSGFSQDGAVQKLLEGGALGVLQKPFRTEELLRKLLSALKTPAG